MLRNQTILVKAALVIVFILLSIFTLKASFAGEHLFWMPIILLPLLLFAFYQIRQEKYRILWKFFIDKQQINIGQQDSREISHSSSITEVKKNDLTFCIGNRNDPYSYETSIFNVRTRKKAVKSLADKSFRPSTIYFDDGNVYNLIEGGRIFHVDAEYRGYRTKRGGFDAAKFKELTNESAVKIIELDLSTPRSSFGNPIFTIETSYIPIAGNKTVLPTLGYTVFSDADGMIHFLERLHNLSGGKPVGIKLRIGSKKEVYTICHAIKKAKFNPHFITIESAEQIGFRSPVEPSSNTTPLCEALLFISKTLEAYELDKKIKIIAAANIVSGAELIKLVSLGADAVWSELVRYKIIKVNKDGTNEYLNYDKRDVNDFHNNIINEAVHIMEANGIKRLNDINLTTFF